MTVSDYVTSGMNAVYYCTPYMVRSCIDGQNIGINHRYYDILALFKDKKDAIDFIKCQQKKDAKAGRKSIYEIIRKMED